MARYRYWVYILASKSGTLYIGETNNLERRIWEHKQKMISGFSQKYDCDKLVYFEEYKEIDEAIAREKQLKKWSREKKVRLIRMINPHWLDLLKGIPRLPPAKAQPALLRKALLAGMP